MKRKKTKVGLKNIIEEYIEKKRRYREGKGICSKCGGKMVFISEGPEDQEASICVRCKCEDCREVLLLC